MTIILYDVPTTPPEMSSDNVWKTRYCLNFKGLPYRTELIEAPELRAFYEKHNITPCKGDEGQPLYSVPFIYDESTQTYVSDSFEVAKYLDQRYPSVPIFSHGTEALQALVEGTVQVCILPGFQLFIDAEIKALNPPSSAYFAPKLRAIADVVKDVPRDALWRRLLDGIWRLSELLQRTEGPFLMGNTASWGDFVIASHLGFIKHAVGEDSEKWREITSTHGGNVGTLMSSLSIYREFY